MLLDAAAVQSISRATRRRLSFDWLRSAQSTRTMSRREIAIAVLAACASACGRRAKVRPPTTARIGDTETGIASWYGHPYHGRRAANGEIYDMDQLTAAHRTLPFNTWLEVENLTNGRTAQVRITDRGPFIDGRIIDLSREAARRIELIGPGITRVRIKVIGAPAGEERIAERFAVQVGAFRDRGRAERLRDTLGRRYGAARIVPRQTDVTLWRVLVGDEPTAEAARGLAERLSEEFGSALVVRLDDTAAVSSLD